MTRFADGPASSPGFQLWRVTLTWQRQITAALAPLGLTHVQFVLLTCTWWMTERGDSPTQADVARQAGVDVKMTSQVLRVLETKNLIMRASDPDDARARRLRLTRAGSALAHEAVVVVEDVDAAFFGSHGRGALRLLNGLPGSLAE